MNAGEAGGGTIDENSAAVNDINNHANLACVLTEVDIGNATRLNEVLEHLKKMRIRTYVSTYHFFECNFILNNNDSVALFFNTKRCYLSSICLTYIYLF